MAIYKNGEIYKGERKASEISTAILSDAKINLGVEDYIVSAAQSQELLGVIWKIVHSDIAIDRDKIDLIDSIISGRV